MKNKKNEGTKMTAADIVKEYLETVDSFSGVEVLLKEIKKCLEEV
jgi:hypothetical protein